MNKLLAALMLTAGVFGAVAHADDVATGMRFADFANAEAGKTSQKGDLSSYGYSEKNGDFAIKKLSVNAEKLAVLEYMLNSKMSNWGGAAMRINGPANGITNISEYTSIKVKISAKDTGRLTIRIVGNEDKVKDGGCYAGYSQKVTPEVTEYTIPFSNFAAGSWCGGNARSIKKTADNVTAVDIFDESLPKTERFSEFYVESVEFVK